MQYVLAKQLSDFDTYLNYVDEDYYLVYEYMYYVMPDWSATGCLGAYLVPRNTHSMKFVLGVYWTSF